MVLAHWIATGIIGSVSVSDPHAIVTLAEAKAWLRVDDDHEDAVIQCLIDAATEAALGYSDAFDRQTMTAPARLKLSILGHIAMAFEERDKIDAPAPSQGLIRPLRSLDI